MKTLRQFLSEGIERHSNFDMLVSKSSREIKAFTEKAKHKGIRFVESQGELYCADAYDATHHNIGELAIGDTYSFHDHWAGFVLKAKEGYVVYLREFPGDLDDWDGNGKPNLQKALKPHLTTNPIAALLMKISDGRVTSSHSKAKEWAAKAYRENVW